jgi:hemoglobin
MDKFLPINAQRSATHAAVMPAWRSWLSGALAALLLLAVTPARAQDNSVYQAFGGKEGIAAIVNDLLINLQADPRTKPYFVDVSAKRFKQKLAEQICQQTGGPCEYTGRTMKESHKGLGIDRPAYYALIEDLQLAMDKHHVPFRAQNKLLAKFAPMYHDIEER